MDIIFPPGDNGKQYTLTEFDIAHALSGGTIFARREGSEPNTYAYFPATEFRLSDIKYATEFEYQAKVENRVWYFNEFGDETHETYTLFKGEATITTHNAGSEQSEGVPGQSGTKYFSLTSLNYRESIAVQALNAMIFHVPDPISYDDASIRLLVSKAFQFSEEFMSQAMTIRTENAEYDDGTIVPKEMTPEEALTNIATQLGAIKDSQSNIEAALIDTSGQDTVSVLTELTGIKDSLGTGETSISSRVATIATNTGNTVSGISTTNGHLTDIKAAVNSIDTNLDGTNSVNSLLESIKSNTNNIQVTAVVDESTVAAGVEAGIQASDRVRDIDYQTYGTETKLDTIQSLVNSINNKIPNPNP